jgi:hypothetical protein
MTYQTDGVAILSDACWRLRFNADPNILGRPIRVDGFQKTIVGVLPPSFRFLSSKAQLYLPLSSNPGDRESRHRHSSNGYEMVARLKLVLLAGTGLLGLSLKRAMAASPDSARITFSLARSLCHGNSIPTGRAGSLSSIGCWKESRASRGRRLGPSLTGCRSAARTS